MRYLTVLLLCAACGRNDCPLEDRTFTPHASATFVGAGCEDLPAAFDVSATLRLQSDGSYILSGTENGVTFATTPIAGTSSDCYANPTWYEGTTSHMYFLSFEGGASRLDVVRTGKCLVSYSLR